MTSLQGAQAGAAGVEPALGDLLVVEIATGVAGPYCGKLLADFGADVIKVELPEGDSSRVVGPFPEGDHDAGALFLWLNANKRGITLDWHRPGGRRMLRELLAKADVLVESGPRATLNRLRLNQKSLARLNPRLIVTAVTPFGASGPWCDRPATDLIVSALGGMSHLGGEASQEPLKQPGPQTEILGGTFGCIGTMCALADRAVTGEGQAVDVSSMEALLGILTPHITQYSYQDKYPTRRPAGKETLFQCADGYVSVTLPNQNGWNFFCKTMGLDDSIKNEPVLATEATRRNNMERWLEVVGAAVATWPKHKLFETLARGRANTSIAFSVPELHEDPHLVERGFFTTVADPRNGDLIYPGPPFRLEANEWRIRRPAPRLGEHNDEVLETVLGYSPRRRAAVRE